MGGRDGLHFGGVVGPGQGVTHLFYDGACGLCCGMVRFVSKRVTSRPIQFAPLGGATFGRLIPPARRTGLPDSLVVLTAEGALLVRSGAVIHLLRQMGPIGRLAGGLLAWFPARPRDWAYDLVARMRPVGRACPRAVAPGDSRFRP